MNDDVRTAFSPPKGITARVCPRGHVYLYVGYTCLALSKNDFLDLAQVVRMAENQLLINAARRPNEPQH